MPNNPLPCPFHPDSRVFSQNEMFARKLTRVKDSPVILSYFLRRYLTMYDPVLILARCEIFTFKDAIAISILKKLFLQINNSDF